MRCGQGVTTAAKGAYETVIVTADSLYEDILPAVEATVDMLGKFHSAMTNFTYMVTSATNLLRDCEMDSALDPDHVMVDGLEEAEKSLRDGVDTLRQKRAAAEADPNLLGENRRRVISAYDRAVVTLEGLHDAAVDFRWAIMEHDANLEPPEDLVTDSVEEILRIG